MSLSLFWRIFLLNAAVLVVATVLLLLGPVTVSAPVVLTEALVLTGGLGAMLVANAVLLRVGLAPLERLGRTMRTIDLLRPGHRLPATGQAAIADLIRTFNAMLDRLEAERASSAARALSAQESERRRVARELHDEIGQTLTAVLLDLKRVADHAPPPVRDELHQVQETTRNSLDEIRRIARRLRPGVLDELGLTSALKALTREYSTGGLTVHRDIDADLPELDNQLELVLYRTAQEGLTNVVRHSGAHTAWLELRRHAGAVELRVRDDGRGISTPHEGAGIRGMRERALLIDADLTIGPYPTGGTEVCLRAPLRNETS
ncbi:HAMP domain-containing sensor histidine kinase [Micromonospora sp. PLK6-60]|uniref:HAMP domain-containing sensor histidine kinase n=1 Tax=Micromonospora sp. PLK6-60 TaxID=2873383 RepID=UPI001CA7B1F6|nr:HAMP domain-containing sensor histidine kinase [Micromonospora sp. PLK6-60]MBY8871401.1 HAMP domain-containing sensor histidine kinase [Micromonospora sp. PLK6-60]